MMKKLRVLGPLLLAALLAAVPAHAQKTKAAITTEINTFFADNTTGQITPAKLRTVTQDIVNSYVDWLVCTGTGGLVYWSGGTPTCISAGTAGQLLQTNGGTLAPSWVTPVSVVAGTGINITGTAPATISIADQIVAGGPIGSATVTPIITYNAQGQLTAVSSVTIAPPFSAVTGIAAMTQGGTGANLTGSAGGIVWTSSASAMAVLAGTATANLPLLSGSSAAPSWAAISYPTSANSGGIPYFSSGTAMASSAALTANRLVLGGGAGTAPTVVGSLGTTTTVLHGNAAGAPTFGAVVSADLNITTTTCTAGQFITAISATATGTCLTARELLTANRTYFVRTDGSNSNTGLVNSAGGAFLTPQKCYDVVVATLDLGGFTVTCTLVNTSSPSTFTSGVSVTQPWTGGGAVTYAGSTGVATDVVVSTTSASAFATTGSLPGTLTIKDMKLQTTTGGDAIFHQATGLVQFTNINFGAVAGTHVDCVGSGVNCEATGNYTISGGGQSHVTASRPSNVSIRGGKTVTLSGTPAFSTAFAIAANMGLIAIDGITFSGSASAGTVRFNVANGGQVYTGTSGSAAYLPGGTVGVGTNYGASPWGLYN